jgi:hypothetical protein
MINAIWLVAGAPFAPLLRDPLRARMINTGLAVVLVVSTAVAVLS